MAEKTSASCSQESLPLSQETCMLLINELGDSFNTLLTDTTLQVEPNLHSNEVLKENKTLKERLAEEVTKSNHLNRLNAEMEARILHLEEKLNEVKSRQDLQQVNLFHTLKEELRRKEIQVEKLQQQLTIKEQELNQTLLICHEETAAKDQAWQILEKVKNRSLNIYDLDFGIDSDKASLAQIQKKKLNEVQPSRKYEEDDMHAFGELPLMEQMEELFRNQFPTDYGLKTPSSLPATENWAGEFGFKVFFSTQESMKAQWVYSSPKNKLYVKKDSPCPISFSTNNFMLDDFCIRTMPLFSSADHILEKVHRCVNHSMLEIQNNRPEAEHLVRVESANAVYEQDKSTERHSVVVPFENPPAGQQFSSYIFKFVCFQSCSGGPNRRPLMLCFTLERRGVVVGRQIVHLKICACPLRDYKTDEKPLHSSENPTKKKSLKREREESDTPKNEESVRNYDLPVILRPGPYYLQVEDRKNYEVLKVIAKIFTTNKPLNRRNLLNLILSTYSSSEDEGKK